MSKTKSILTAFVILMLLPFAFIFSACDWGVKPVAVTVYQPQGTEYVIYETDQVRSQVYVFASQADVPTAVEGESLSDWHDRCEHACILRIFFLNGAAPHLEEHNLYVTIEKWYTMNVVIKSTYYSSSKSVYVNGQAITPTSNTGTTDHYLNFEDNKGGFVLKRSNPNGHMTDIVNTIEYK